MAHRNTRQRQLVLEAVRSLASHPTADDVLAYVTEALPGVSRATIYNNLNQLVSDGLVGRVRYPGEPDRFDGRTARHLHFRCDVCGRVFDYDEPVSLSSPPPSTDELEVTGYDIWLSGTCRTCRDKRPRTER
ncbi:MAG: transcriptional repressor [Atopobiaceae bacterium]|jgi:Fe2+ or Zn2+ uptake regulation protein|nr:transcriptional repressor [Atopobiaceae bacterium]